MSEKVLTEEEKEALLDGVASGEVEVQSAKGTALASVSEFEFAPSARIVKNGFPRLQLLNQQLADQLADRAEQLLQREVTVVPSGASIRGYGDVKDELAGPAAVTLFEAAPLQGLALVAIRPTLVRNMVDAFFGGAGEEDGQLDNGFTPGEMSVSRLFTAVVLKLVEEVWKSILDISPQAVQTRTTMEVVDLVARSERVLDTEFKVSVGTNEGEFRVLWPEQMVVPLLPAFDGQKMERDPKKDRHWQQVITRRVQDSAVNVTASVGYAKMTLRSLIDISPGDVINIDDPHHATLLTKNVALLRGRFGVHRGTNAFEAIDWIDDEAAEAFK